MFTVNLMLCDPNFFIYLQSKKDESSAGSEEDDD